MIWIPCFSTFGWGRELQGKSSSRNDRMIFNPLCGVQMEDSDATPALQQVGSLSRTGALSFHPPQRLSCSTEAAQRKMSTQGVPKEPHQLGVHTGRSIRTNDCGPYGWGGRVQDATEVALVELGWKLWKSGSRHHLAQYHMALFPILTRRGEWLSKAKSRRRCRKKEGWILGRQNQQT